MYMYIRVCFGGEAFLTIVCDDGVSVVADEDALEIVLLARHR